MRVKLTFSDGGPVRVERAGNVTSVEVELPESSLAPPERDELERLCDPEKALNELTMWNIERSFGELTKMRLRVQLVDEKSRERP